MKSLALTLLILTASSLAFGEETPNPVDALIGSRVAFKFLRSKNGGELIARFLLEPADKALLKKEWAKADYFKKPLPEFKYEDNKISFWDPWTMEVDFNHISQGFLFLNGHKVNLSKKINYIEAKVLVDDFLKKSSSEFYFFEPWVSIAEASPLDRAKEFVKSIYAALVADTSSLSLLARSPSVALDEIIMKIYDKEFGQQMEDFKSPTAKTEIGQDYRDYNPMGKIPAWDTLLFECKGMKLISLKDVRFREKQTLIYSEFDVGSKGYELKTFKPDVEEDFECRFSIAPSGKLTNIESGRVTTQSKLPVCAYKGAKLLWTNVYDLFQSAAQACCAKAGCYEKVSAKIQSLREQLQQVPPRSAPARVL